MGCTRYWWLMGTRPRLWEVERPLSSKICFLCSSCRGMKSRRVFVTIPAWGAAGGEVLDARRKVRAAWNEDTPSVRRDVRDSCDNENCVLRLHFLFVVSLGPRCAVRMRSNWTRWGLNPGHACWAGVTPLHHVPRDCDQKSRC